MLWDFSSQIRKVFFQSANKHIDKKICLRPKYYHQCMVLNKESSDTHQFFDQSTLEMVTYVFLSVKCNKYVQNIQIQLLSSLLFSGK